MVVGGIQIPERGKDPSGGDDILKTHVQVVIQLVELLPLWVVRRGAGVDFVVFVEEVFGEALSQHGVAQKRERELQATSRQV